MSSQLERSDSEKTMILGQEGGDTTMASQEPASQHPAPQDPAEQRPSPQDPATQCDAPVEPAEFAPSRSEESEDPDEPTYRVLDAYGHRIVVEGEVSPMALLLGNNYACAAVAGIRTSRHGSNRHFVQPEPWPIVHGH